MPIDLLAESQPEDLLAGEPLPKPRGMISAFGAGAKSTVGSVAQAAGRFAGMPDVAKWGEEVQAGSAPIGEEGLPAHVARAVGGMAAYLPAIIGTAAVLPEATGAGVAALGLNAARGFASMALPATVAKINRSADLKAQGVDAGTAEAAGWADAATTGLMGVVPVAMAGKLTTRLSTGAGSNIAVGELARHAQNVVLSDNPEQQSKFAAVDLATNGIVGAFMGGILGKRPIKADTAKAAADAQKLIDNPDALLEPTPPALPSPDTTIYGTAEGQTKTPQQVELERAADAHAAAVYAARATEETRRAEFEGRVAAPTPITEPAPAPVIEPVRIPDRHEISRIAAEVLGGEGAIPASHLAQAVKDAASLTEVADRLRVRAAALKDTGQNIEKKGALTKLADHLDPPKPEGAKIEETTKTVTPETQQPEAPAAALIPEENQNAVQIREEARVGKEVGTQVRGAEGAAQEGQGRDAASAREEIAAGPFADVMAAAETRVSERLAAKDAAAKAEADRVNAKLRADSGILGENIPEGLGRNIPKEGRYADEPAVESASEKHWDEARATKDGTVPKYKDLSSGAQEWVQTAMNRFGRVPEEFYRGAMAAHAKGEVFKSETGARIGKPSTVASIKAELVKDFADEGRLFRQTIIHETQADAVAAGHMSQTYTGKARGWYDPATNKVHLVAENIEQGRVLGVFLHEMGVHAGMDRLVGKPGMDWLTSRVDQWAALNDGSQEALAAQEAVSRASRSTSTDTSQEKIAYMVEALVNAEVKPKAGKGAEGWLHKIIGYLKLALEKLHLKASSYSGQNLIDLAYGAANIELGTVKMPTSFPGFRTGAQAGFKFSEVDAAKSPQNTFNAIEGVVKSVTDSVEKAAPHIVDRASAAGRKLWLYTSGLGHIVDVVERLKWLPPAGQEALRRLSLMLHKGDTLNRNLNHDSTLIYDLMRGLKRDELAALAELKGELHNEGVYPFEDDTEFEKRTKAARTPAQATMYRRARQLYANKDVAKAYDAERAYNKKLHDMRSATLLRSQAQSEGLPRALWEPVDVTEGLSSVAAKRLVQHINALEKTDVDAFNRFKSTLAMYEASHAPAYFHHARFGDHMAYFEVADTPTAVDGVLNALKIAGVRDRIVLTPSARGKRVFLKFENASEMRMVESKLAGLQAAGHIKEGFSAGAMAEKLQELDSVAPSGIRAMMERISNDTQMLPEEKTAQMELIRRMYMGMLPEGNASKLYMRNAKVDGYSSDMARAFAEQAGMEAYYISQHAIRPDVSEARSDLRKVVKNMTYSTLKDENGVERRNVDYNPVTQPKAVDVLNEVNHRIANKITLVNTPMQDKLQAFGHTVALTLSPSYLIQGLFQNLQLGLPLLGGRHGFVNSAKALAAAAEDAYKILKLTARGAYKNGGMVGVADSPVAIKASHLSEPEKAALEAAVAVGRLEFTRAGELTHIREGASPAAERALKVANTLAYYGEVFNRITMALAAHRLETARQVKANESRPADKKLAPEQMLGRVNDYVVEMIDGAHINYTKADEPRFLGKHGVFGSASPLVFQFQKFGVSVVQTLGRLTLESVAKIDAKPGTPEHAAQIAERAEARKSLMGLMATTTALAGTMGLPLMGVIAGAYNALAGDEDEPEDFKTNVQNWTSDWVGQDMGRLISHGAFDFMTNATMSSKLGLDNLLPFTQLASQMVDQRRAFKDRVDAGAFQFLGPAIGMGANMAQGLGMLADGRMQQGLEKLSPAATRGLVKAHGLAEHGFTDAGGHPIGKDAAWNDIVVQSLGIAPTEVSRRMEAAQGVKAIEGALSLRVSELQDRFVRAVDAGDVEARMQVVNEVTEFRRKNPSVKVDLGAAVQRARRTQASAVASGVGISGSARRMQDIREQTRFLQE